MFHDTQALDPTAYSLSQLGSPSIAEDDQGSLNDFIVPDTSQVTLYDASQGGGLTQADRRGLNLPTTPEIPEGPPACDFSSFYLITWPHPVNDAQQLLKPGDDLSKESFAAILQESFNAHNEPSSMLSRIWALESADATLQRESMSRMAILKETAE
ncbi:hypothetical protein FOL47_003098, partial [Perkinsus chesapeaki]